MPNEVLRKVGDDIVFAELVTFSPSAANTLSSSYTGVQLDLTSILDTEARESDKVDLGARRAPAYSVMACIEFNTAPTAGDPVEFYWAPSRSATAANANVGGVSGGDADFTGYSADVASAVAHMQLIGILPCDNVGTAVQIALIGSFSPSERYGSLVVVNNCGQTLFTDAIEHHVVFSPTIDEVQ